MPRWAGFYGQVRRGDVTLVAMAAAHQRLGWIHPFIDGNRRVMRLHTHTLLKSDSPQGKVRFGLPQHALRFLFPQLWPEAEADAGRWTF